jgi:D-serine deaminase-like pyridoxal phosphate-dependent protein
LSCIDIQQPGKKYRPASRKKHTVSGNLKRPKPMDQQKKEWFTIDNIDQLDSPALVIYPDRVKENIRLVVEMVGGQTASLRPHIKTHKSPDVTRLMLEAGIHKFKCATIAEAEMLALCGAEDVLLAYQPVGPKLHRFVSLLRKYPATKFSCLIDNPVAAREMDAVFSEAHCRVPVFIDLNLGMNRTGILPGEAAIRLYKEASQARGIIPVGLHAYDGHIRDTDFEQRKQTCDAAFATVTALAAALTDGTPALSSSLGIPPASGPNQAGAAPIIVAGGSPTFSIHCKREGIECSPGTFIYWDRGYSVSCPEQAFSPAALVITRVVSLPDPTKLCLDLGHKSIAAENELSRRVFFLNAPELQPLGQSEEHLVVDAGPGHSYQVGDVLYGLPIHICPTVALYERAYTIEKGRVSGEWRNTARDKKISL